MKIVCRLLVAMAILTVGLVQVSLAAESNDLASAYHRAEQMRAGRLAAKASNLSLTPVWDAGGDAFWFQRQGVDGSSYIAVDPVCHSKRASDALPESVLCGE